VTIVGAAVSTKTGQTYAQAIQEFEVLTGRPMVLRRCYDSGVPTTIQTSAMRHDIGKRKSLWSFKPSTTTSLSTLDTLAQSIADSGHPCDVIIYHEPADNMSAQTFKDLYLRSAAPFRSREIPTGVVYTNWTCNLPYTDAKSVLPAYWPGDGNVDFIGIDEYATEILQGKDAPPMSERAYRVCQFADAHDVELGLAEYGANGDADIQKSERFMRSVCDWALARNVAGRQLRWFSYFSSSVGGNYWLSNNQQYVDAYVDAYRLLNTG
jgi:hypothetical protein